MACTVTWGCQLSVLLLNSYMEAMCCSSLTLLHVCRSYLPVQWFAQSKPNSCLDICLHIVHTISTEPMTAWSIDLYTLYGTVPCLWGFRSVPLLDTQEVCVFLAGEHYYQEAWLFGICCVQIPHWLKCWSICLLKAFGGLVNHLKAQSSVVSRNSMNCVKIATFTLSEFTFTISANCFWILSFRIFTLTSLSQQICRIE